MKRKKRDARRWRKYRQPKATPVHFVRLRLPRVEIAPGRKWFVVRTLPRMDQRVAEELQALGAETYVPVLVEERVRRGRRIEHPQHPAAGYVFAGTTLAADGASVLGHVDGAVEVLAADGGPSEVKPEALQLFADILTRCNEEAREASSTVAKPRRIRGLAHLREVVYGDA
jgi:hypothetical protein